MMTRDQFISKISAALERPRPAADEALNYRHNVHKQRMQGLSQDELCRAFCEASEALGVNAVQTTSEKCADAVAELIANASRGTALLAADPMIERLGLAQRLKENINVAFWDVTRSRDENIAVAEQASIGIAVAEVALAETGTVMLLCYSGSGRSVSLLPQSTIYLIPQSRLRPRLTQAMEHIQNLDGALPTSINFVTGPSATADIELVRVVGVHGPMAVTHVVISDM